MDKYFKRSVVLWLLALIITAAFVSLAGCSAKPKTSEDKTEIKSDSIATNHTEKEKETVNQAVIDSLLLVIATVRTAKPECDSVCQLYVDDLMARMEMQKTSGDNSFSVTYDEYTKALKVAFKQGATSSTTKVVTDYKYINHYYNINKTKTVTVAITPPYMKYSAWFGWLCAAFIIIYGTLKVRSWAAAKYSL